MGSRASTLLVQLLLVAAGVGAYHLATVRGTVAPPEAPPTPPVVEAPPAASGLPPLAASPGFVRFEELERRVAALERALSNASALAPGVAPVSPGGPNAAPIPAGSAPVWTEDQLKGLRAMIAEIEVRKNQENYAASMRAVLRGAAKTPIREESETRAIALLVAFQRKIAEIFPEGSGGANLEERQRSLATAQGARDALEEEIRRVLPTEVAEKILSMVPQYPARFDPDMRTPPMGDGR